MSTRLLRSQLIPFFFSFSFCVNIFIPFTVYNVLSPFFLVFCEHALKAFKATSLTGPFPTDVGQERTLEL